MTKFKFSLSFAVLLLVLVLGLGAAEKQKSDKERITVLEQVVTGLQMDLAGAHEWADLTNQRVYDLNERLKQVESRGPVALNGDVTRQ